MGRKKVDKTSVEYLSKNLFHKKDIVGFQFTAGETPLGIKENRQLTMSCSLNKSRSSVVIDCSEWDLKRKIETEVFGMEEFPVDKKSIKDLQKQFRDLGYEVEEASYAGYWYWFRVKCTAEEIPMHVNILKEKIVKC